MTVIFDDAYTLPGGDEPLKNARVLHKGNAFMWKSVTATAEATGYEAEGAVTLNTVDKWRPFENDVTDPTDLSTSNWTAFEMTVGADGQTLTENTATAGHKMRQTGLTFSAAEYVYAVKVKRMNREGLRLAIRDPAIQTATFSLDDGTMQGNGSIVDHGDDIFTCKLYATTAANAGGGILDIDGYDGASTSYTGDDTVPAFQILEVSFHLSIANLTLTSFADVEADAVCIAGHNLGNSEGELTVYHTSVGGANRLGTDDIADNSPVMNIFEPTTASVFIVRVTRCVLPEIAIVQVGKLLQFEQPFYAGFTPGQMNRQTAITGNMSGSGDLLGASIRRTVLSVDYSWEHLTEAWVRANLLGRFGFIRAIEAAPFFVAWRPGEEGDVDFVMRGSSQRPSAMGVNDKWTFSASGEALQRD